jgi:4-amino-4-deoxy-L-arabinose transferase-like glycosyltransferase
VAIVTGVALRTVAPAAMWLDEAQTVAIARLPVPAMLDALRADGAPPLSYLLLHAWMGVFGSGTTAVRSLSMLLGVLAVPLAARAARAAGGSTRAATAAAVLVATSPFAIRYSSEARMYALVLVLALAAAVLVLDRRPDVGAGRLTSIAALSAALLLTHYWALFVIGATVVALAIDGARRVERRRRSWSVAAALAAGGIAFLPWLPSFLHQARMTGAPWGRPPGATIVERAVRGFTGGGDAGALLEVVVLLAAGAALVLPLLAREHGTDRRRPRPTAAALVVVALVTLALGAVSLALSGDAFAPRHATVAFAPLVLGLALLTDELEPVAAIGLVAVAAVLGLAVAIPAANEPRTQAPAIAAALRSRLAPGDVVAVCPDQLAPALSRLLGPAFQPRLLPAGSGPDRIDWTSYRARVLDSDPATFAADLDRAAGRATVWLVSSPNYVGVGRRCTAVRQALTELRPGTAAAVHLHPDVYENAALWRAPSQENQ